ncbi:Rossman fold protein, TIGR00730 family [Candidatus Kaiserbacteria bacterium RIFCSPLOWO2_01_FULL_54_13]|uniref:Cytokinin riboside 5'-monophosphate phosphoribohydrolase n=1 Tax=Candidatus Kaiserbacteria bacterium RIFCSPLOWO2_01_FULL_54_13 TaxID=1798512 RepID=A0A1F6F227_9BACT|nr:MAG: Rossman fold protein, TIGR00730 family [Candidatus Kaiserbacteria bacterium RIFCSPLOWO2_01_FULL_54_13]
MNICIFCSMYEVDKKYTAPAVELAREIGRRGNTLVWGGSDNGLMRRIASAVQESGGKIVGVTMERIKENARKKADEMIVTKDLAERKRLMRDRADAFVLLPGGIGSLDEITEILEFKKHGMNDKPVVILNTDNFYEGLKSQLERMKREGFISLPLEEFIYFADTPDAALSYLER